MANENSKFAKKCILGKTDIKAIAFWGIVCGNVGRHYPYQTSRFISQASDKYGEMN